MPLWPPPATSGVPGMGMPALRSMVMSGLRLELARVVVATLEEPVSHGDGDHARLDAGHLVTARDLYLAGPGARKVGLVITLVDAVSRVYQALGRVTQDARDGRHGRSWRTGGG